MAAFARKDLRYLFLITMIPILVIALIHYKTSDDDDEDFFDANGAVMPSATLANANYMIEKAKKKGVKLCRGSTVNNPYANPLPTDYGSGLLVLPACNPADKDVQEQIKKNFEAGNTPIDDSDYFNRRQGQLAFHQVAQRTVPPDADRSFAKWLYQLPDKSCKEQHGNCRGYSDLRYQRPVQVDPTRNPSRA